MDTQSLQLKDNKVYCELSLDLFDQVYGLIEKLGYSEDANNYVAFDGTTGRRILMQKKKTTTLRAAPKKSPARPATSAAKKPIKPPPKYKFNSKPWPKGQFREWRFTYWPTDNETLEEFIKEQLQIHTIIRYGVAGDEICPETNKRHFQGWLYIPGKATGKLVKALFNRDSTNINITNGGFAANRDYCIKSGNYLEFGKPPAQGERSDLDT